jgi:hypothetical protein
VSCQINRLPGHHFVGMPVRRVISAGIRLDGCRSALNTPTAPYAVLLLRLCLGAMFIAHAMLKWRVFTIPGTIAFFTSLGLPGWLAALLAVFLLGDGAATLVASPSLGF